MHSDPAVGSDRSLAYFLKEWPNGRHLLKPIWVKLTAKKLCEAGVIYSYPDRTKPTF
jgi:hypothetical protein